MTTPRYPSGCAAGSQVRGEASDSSYAWVVHFGYGFALDLHRDDGSAFVRAVRASPAGQ